jgi:hypothetical protein
VPKRNPARLAKVGGLVGLVALLATGCSGEEVLRFGWPEAVTPQAERMSVFWTWATVAALVVGVLEGLVGVLHVDDRQPVEAEDDVRVVPRAALVRPAVARAAQRVTHRPGPAFRVRTGGQQSE